MLTQPEQTQGNLQVDGSDPTTGALAPTGQPSEQPLAVPASLLVDTNTPSNQMGNARPLFNEGVVNNANNLFGDVTQRQTSVGLANPNNQEVI